MYLHKKVRARADKTTVRIYFGTELIKMHPRKAPGGRSTDTGDYPVGKAAYALRSVDALVAKAKEKGVHVGTYAERIVGGPLPWTRMRQAYALLRLCEIVPAQKRSVRSNRHRFTSWISGRGTDGARRRDDSRDAPI